ncbi:T9SS type A sorting domain-containing protein [Marinoscillum furvescens]|uniref:Putative secreted protein (Por secretion system target) n=1 Tax=Marinoscillum furvescens DSM 4134 TaxID=1122208 RepID=A0A3D9L0U3_MARFU|nr:T9SS type A sorting domain-containing protein [Marinoscillum furvescens]RED96643.1 putative secreted protein (Por secretion system target) [Marinoscillum furvescens DSM 4134]
MKNNKDLKLTSFLHSALLIMLLGVVVTNAWAQESFFQKGISIRNYEKSHYHKMVGWDDSEFKEFAYWKENSQGGIMEFMNWRAIFPPGYDSTSADQYPMIILMHGAGESGRKWTGYFNYEPTDPEYDNNGHHLLWGGRKHRNAVNNGKFPGIVLFAQSSYNAAWDSDEKRMLAGIIEHMIQHYQVNPYRISMHGLSNGAKGTWDFVNYRPDLIAAILPMSGIGADLESTTETLTTTPVWLFQGGEDTNPSPGAAEQWIETLEEKGGKPKLTIYPDNGHNTWNEAYYESDFFPFMRRADKRNIHIFGDTSNLYITEHGEVKLGFSAGFSAYQWTKDGQDLEGTDSRYYTVMEPGTYSVKFQAQTTGQWDESFPVEIEAYSGDPIVHIPDNNFKSLLLNDTSINTNGDGQIQVSEAENFNGQLKANSADIHDLTGIAAFKNITDLRVHYNNLTSLDVSSNKKLQQLHCQHNMLESLNISLNPDITKLRCFDNQLTELNIKNGNNDQFDLFQAKNNALSCIQVDDAPAAEAQWSDNVDPDVTFRTQCGQAIVAIPDANFKQALLNDHSIDTNEDGEIQYEEAEQYSGELVVENQQIDDLTGLEAFTEITKLDFKNNNVSSLNISSNTQLRVVIGAANQLSSVNFGDNSNLHTVKLNSNTLTSLEPGALPVLEVLDIQFNQLTELTLSENTLLDTLYCNNNQLTTLNLKNGQNEHLEAFDASANELTCIDVSNVSHAEENWQNHVDPGVSFKSFCNGAIVNIPDQNFKDALLAISELNTNQDSEIQVSEAEAFSGQINVNSADIADLTGIEHFTALTDLRIHNNQLQTLDLSANTALKQLHCQKNSLTSLDISANPNIKKLRCFQNSLSTLNVQNGNNENFHLFQATENNLSCVQVDDVAYAENNWQDDVDQGVVFDTDCSSGSTSRMAKSQQAQPKALAYPNPFDTYLTIRLGETQEKSGRVTVREMTTGKLVAPKVSSSSSGLLKLDFSAHPQGHYLLEIQGRTYRVIKQ